MSDSNALPSILEGLTDPQKKAVLHTEGPLLVLAAAGSGKTRVITRRIAHLMEKGAPPWAILAVTFTNKAAGEMRERIARLLEEHGSRWGERSLRGLTITTFHSLCARLLRRYAEAAGLKADFTIYDDGDQISLCKRVIGELQLASSNWPPRGVLSTISAAKNDLLDAEAYALRAGDYYARTVAKIYTAYSKALRAANAVDFDDLLVLTAKMLKADRHVRTELTQRWRYLMIDEYQDTNGAQFAIANLLGGGTGSVEPDEQAQVAPPAANICVVGDPDQAIYGWRGADITNILEFEDNYPKAAVIKLGENFRSTAPILACADGLIKHNLRRKDKPLFTSREGGEKPVIVLCRDEQHEARLVADWLRNLHMGDGGETEALAWKEMAIFYRTNALSRVMEDAMRSANIPYSIARGTAFYEREEIRNAIAYLRVVANPADTVSLERVINTPTRGIGGTSIERMETFAAERGVTLFEAMRSVGEVQGLTARAVASVRKFVEQVDLWTGGGSFMGQGVPESLAQLVERVIVESGLQSMYREQAKASKSDGDNDRLDNLDELISSARQFELEYDPAGDPAFASPPGAATIEGTVPAKGPLLLELLRAYLESITLIADADAVDPDQGAVTMMTLHAAKGLEFAGVAMIGLEENLLPHSRALADEAQMEEERRLCFVGITRAMRHLHLSSAKYRTHRGLPERTIPSRFVQEIPPQHRILSDQSDVAGGLGGAWGEKDDAFGEPKPGKAEQRFVPDEDAPALRNPALPIGAVVRHPQFGEGKVIAVTAGSNARATISFRSVGVKTLVLEYARLQRVS